VTSHRSRAPIVRTPLGHNLPQVLLGYLAVLGCASSGQRADEARRNDHLPGVWHVVVQGETAASIAEQAHVPLDDFLELNGIRKNEVLQPGRPVFVLDTGHAGEGPTGQGRLSPSRVESRSNAPLHWPVTAPRISSPFGRRWGKDHEGIDMAAPVGTPVHAAASGKVIYAGDQVRGYGNMVVIRHDGDIVTVYAHNSVLLVRTGDSVALGQEIARVGDTGRSTAPHLHFEVRRGDSPRDPMQFLPPLP